MARSAFRRSLFSAVSLCVITLISLLVWMNRPSFLRVTPIDLPGGHIKGPPHIAPPSSSTSSPHATTTEAPLISETAHSEITSTSEISGTPTTTFDRAATSFFGPGPKHNGDTSTESATESSPSSSSTSDTEDMPAATETAGPEDSGPEQPIVVTLRQGAYAGRAEPASAALPRPVEAFRGIPYAQSTAGENRFRPPQPLPDRDETFPATYFGPACPSDGYNAESEDCLNLNVYRPVVVGEDGDGEAKKREGKLLPVAVYVHGGAFNGGYGAERNMASFVAYAAADIIGINFNYRVGALGFLPSSLAAREGILNLGLRDQQALFAWVQANIGAFGGDPDNVTIMGLSAGAHSIGHHLLHYPPGEAPFHRAILESGAPTARAVFVPSHPRHEVQFRAFLTAAGVEGVPEDEVLAALRALPLETVRGASRAVWDKANPSVTWPFQPAIDGLAASNGTLTPSNTTSPILYDLPIRRWRAGKHARVPVLTGFNSNEGTLFVPATAATDADFRAFFAELIPTLSPADLTALAALYPDPVTDPESPYAQVPAGYGAQWARLDAAYAHYAYICPVLQTAQFLSREGDAAAAEGEGERGGPPPVFVYEFAARSGASGTANHGDNAPLVAHDPGSLAGFAGLTAAADVMNAAWTRFVATGDPNPPSSSSSASTTPRSASSPSSDDDDEATPPPVAWEAFAGAAPRLMVFAAGNDEAMGEAGTGATGTPARMRGLRDGEVAQCRFWWDRAELSEGLGVPRPSKETGAKL